MYCSRCFFGDLFPNIFEYISSLEYAGVNFIIAILIWTMIYPMMIQIDFNAIKSISTKPKGLFLTIVINWLIKPFAMALIAFLFFKIFFANYISFNDANEYIAGLILLGVAPCTAMVFIWSQLTKGDPNYTLLQVAVNDIIMVFAFVPIASFLLGINNINIPWNTLLISVLLYVVLPLLMGVITRYIYIAYNQGKKIDNLICLLKPISIVGLLSIVILLFAFQAEKMIKNPIVIILISIPLIIQTYIIFFITYFIARYIKLTHNVASPAAMIGASNFFELAVAVAISLFGLESGAVLATVVGVLVEVPIMLSLVSFSNRTRHWFH